MSVYDVWAPKATTVHLHLDGDLLPLTAEADTGWWRAPADLDRGPGHRYGFLLDDGETPLPDPRSRRQPDGVSPLRGSAGRRGTCRARRPAGGDRLRADGR